MALSFIVTGTAWSGCSILASGSNIPARPGLAKLYVRLIKDSDMTYAWSLPRSGRPPASSWRCFSPDYGEWTQNRSVPRVDGARVRSTCTQHPSWPGIRIGLRDSEHMSIKSYDLIIALTNGGPGRSTWLPSVFMYQYSFTRNEMAVAPERRDDAAGGSRSYAILPLQRNAQGENA
jgi:glucose/mannose transport system permease protein